MHLVRPLDIPNFISMRKQSSRELLTPAEYDQKIAAAGSIDFALHGIGRNGHIGFNEPESDPNSVTRIVNLAPKTRRDNFPQMDLTDSPSHGMTLGLRDLARVKHTLLIASGEHKADAMSRLVGGSSISETPACALLNCRDFGVIMDRQAAKVILG